MGPLHQFSNHPLGLRQSPKGFAACSHGLVSPLDKGANLGVILLRCHTAVFEPQQKLPSGSQLTVEIGRSPLRIKISRSFVPSALISPSVSLHHQSPCRLSSPARGTHNPTLVSTSFGWCVNESRDIPVRVRTVPIFQMSQR